MTLSEFKYWLEGFEEACGPAPNTAQWEKIKEMLDQIEPKAEIKVVTRDVPFQIPAPARDPRWDGQHMRPYYGTKLRDISLGGMEVTCQSNDDTMRSQGISDATALMSH